MLYQLSYSRKYVPVTCVAGTLYIEFYFRLLEVRKDCCNLTRAYGTTTLTDSETKTFVQSNLIDQIYFNLNIITRHYHFNAFWQLDFTRAVHRAEIELRTILVTEGSVTTTFFLLEDIDGSLELLVRLDNAGVSNHHTALDFSLVDTTEEETYVVTSFTLIKELAEHFNAGNHRLLVFTKTEDLNFITDLNDTGFYTTGSNSTTASDREHVFNRHQEGLIAVAFGFLNPIVNSIHELEDAFFPLGNTIQAAESRTTDDGSIFFEVVLRKEILHIHFYEFEHFFVFNHVALVEEHNEAGHVHLTSKKDVLTSLGHRTIRSSNYDDSTVHLGSTRYHVLHIVGVTRAVNVSIVTIGSFIFNVRRVDRDTTFLFFRSIVNLVERLHFAETILREYMSNSGSKSSLTVVNVTDGTNVHVRLGTLKLFFCHCIGVYLIIKFY